MCNNYPAANLIIPAPPPKRSTLEISGCKWGTYQRQVQKIWAFFFICTSTQYRSCRHHGTRTLHPPGRLLQRDLRVPIQIGICHKAGPWTEDCRQWYHPEGTINPPSWPAVYFKNDSAQGGQYKRGSTMLWRAHKNLPKLRLSIQYFFRHIIKIEQRYVPHVFAFVEWLKPSQPFPSYQDLDMHVFQTTCFPASKDSIIPVHRMYSGVGIQKLNTENTCSAFHLSRKIKITDH